LSSEGTVRLEERDGVRWVTLDRPPVNALSLTEYAGLAEAFAVGGSGPRLVVVRAEGRVWSAGQDTGELAGLDGAGRAGYLEAACRGVAAAARCPVPVVTALHGPAVGAGALIVAVSDVVVAADDAWLAFPEAVLGMELGLALLGSLPRAVAFHAMSTGERVPASRLAAVGFLEATLPAGEVDAETRRRVEELLALPDSTLRWLRSAADPEGRASAYEREVSAVVEALRSSGG
jgi:enoyl-CoA hydratase